MWLIFIEPTRRCWWCHMLFCALLTFCWARKGFQKKNFCDISSQQPFAWNNWIQQNTANWEQMKADGAHMSGSKQLAVLRGGSSAKPMSKLICLRSPKIFERPILLFRKFLLSTINCKRRGGRTFSWLTIPENFVDRTFWCFWVIARACCKLYLHAEKLCAREK